MIDQDETPILTLPGPWGVPIQIAPSFGLLALLLVGFDPSMGSVAFFGIVAVSILLHELGHAWGNRVQGLRVERVVLWGGGGFCVGDPRATPRERELVVAMGPLTNLALWAICGLAVGWIDGRYMAAAIYPGGWATTATLLEQAAWINLFLFGLNLVPVQPLDGGKLLHLGLLRVLDRRRAAWVAGAVGLVLSVLWIPAMIAAFFAFGFALLFLPSIALHRAMMRGGAVA
ncbi:site-2 protease family protein [Jannaschia sp. Os4]|uniref:site-2 protease family protein n=1 Tax=Jannaschia sp. Os4 TaxID=2807617 RepID=UPI0019399814|nr:site-2 protease family protein [Jannaschia sp. Os4]MBM2575041.1 site-2 protease family protein [Jannaschia sp. Os4]